MKVLRIFLFILIMLMTFLAGTAAAFEVGSGAPDLAAELSFKAAYNRNGGQDNLGMPIGDIHRWGAGYTQDLVGGWATKSAIMMADATNKAFVVQGDQWAFYENEKGDQAAFVIGYPTNDVHRWENGWTQNFDYGSAGGGAIMKGDDVGVNHWVHSGFWNYYAANRGPLILGYPITEEYTKNGLTRQDFETGLYLIWNGTAAQIMNASYVKVQITLYGQPFSTLAYFHIDKNSRQYGYVPEDITDGFLVSGPLPPGVYDIHIDEQNTYPNRRGFRSSTRSQEVTLGLNQTKTVIFDCFLFDSVIAKAGPDQTASVGDVVNFDGTSSFIADFPELFKIVEYTWDFDGSYPDDYTETPDNAPDGSFDGRTTHVFNKAGTYDVSLKVRDDGGEYDSDFAKITVVNSSSQPPVANAGPDKTTYTGYEVHLDGSGSRDPDGQIISYKWDFGDGSSGTGLKVSHEYKKAGTYKVYLTVTDNDGAKATDKATITVNAPISTKNFSDWHSGDGHTHSEYSDGGKIPTLFWEDLTVHDCSIDNLVDRANKARLDWIAVTDHNDRLDQSAWNQVLNDMNNAQERWVKPVIPGQEVNVGEPKVSLKGHYLTYGIKNYFQYEDPGTKNMSQKEVMYKVFAEGGFGYIAHPFEKTKDIKIHKWPGACWGNEGDSFEIIRDNLARSRTAVGMELMSGKDIPSWNAINAWNWLMQNGLAGFAVAGNSDFHIGYKVQHVGSPCTYTYAKYDYGDDVIDKRNKILGGLERGKTVATNGPMVLFTVKNGEGIEAGIGDTLSVKPGEELEIWLSWDKKSSGQGWSNIFLGFTDGCNGAYRIVKVREVMNNKIPDRLESYKAKMKIPGDFDGIGYMYAFGFTVQENQIPVGLAYTSPIRLDGLPPKRQSGNEETLLNQPHLMHSSSEWSQPVTIEEETLNRQAIFSASIPGSSIDMTLAAPDGEIFDATDVSSSFGYEGSGTSKTYYVNNPEPGQWMMNIICNDAAPEGEEVTATAQLIRFTPPRVTIEGPESDAFIKSQTQVLANASDDDGVNKVSLAIDGEEIKSDPGTSCLLDWDTSLISDGPHNISAWAIDVNGETGVDSRNVIVDNTPPIASDNASPNWSNQDVEVSITAEDEVSDVKEIRYSIDGGIEQIVASSNVKVLIQALTDHTNDGSHILIYHAVDNAGNASDPKSTTVKIDTTPPSISTTPKQLMGYPKGDVTFQLVADDKSSGVADINGSLAIQGSIVPVMNGTTLSLQAGMYALNVTALDNAGNSSTEEAVFAVYDPHSGNITGHGWIPSQVGSYCSNKKARNKAHFGVECRRSKHKANLEGHVTFRFHDFRFSSTSLDWYVLTSNQAKIKGSGQLNGKTGYEFMLTAIDEGFRFKADKFRMKIWNKNTGIVIYDNKMGASDVGYDATAIGGGSVVIHK